MTGALPAAGGALAGTFAVAAFVRGGPRRRGLFLLRPVEIRTPASP